MVDALSIWDCGFGIGDFGLDYSENPKSQIRIPKSKWVAENLEETEGLEPSTLSFEARRSVSIELRLQKVVSGEW